MKEILSCYLLWLDMSDFLILSLMFVNYSLITLTSLSFCVAFKCVIQKFINSSFNLD